MGKSEDSKQKKKSPNKTHTITIPITLEYKSNGTVVWNVSQVHHRIAKVLINSNKFPDAKELIHKDPSAICLHTKDGNSAAAESEDNSEPSNRG